MQDRRISPPVPPEEGFYGFDFQEPEIHLRDYIAILLARKWIVILGFLAVMIPCLYYLQTTLPVYKSTAVLLYEEQGSTPLLLGELQGVSSSLQLEAQMRILKSPPILAEIAKRINSQPEFQVTNKQLAKSISLNTLRGTDILELSGESFTDDLAALIANTAVSVYLEKTQERKRADLDQAIDFLKKQMTSVDEMLEQNERELNAFREQYGLIPKEGLSLGSGLLQQLGKMQQDLLDTQGEVRLTKMQLESITELLQQFREHDSETDSSLQSFKGSAFIQNLHEKIIDLKIALDTARQEYKDESGQVKTLEGKLQSVQMQLDEEIAKIAAQDGIGGLDPLSELQNLVRREIDLTVALSGLEQKEELIEANIQDFRTKHPQLISKEVELLQLQRKARLHEETHGFLMKSLADTQMLRQMQTSELSVITNAAESRVPIKPRKKMTLIIGAVLGVMLGIGGALFLEYMDNSLRKKEEVERWLGLPVVGTIPRIPMARNKKIEQTLPNGSGESAYTDPDSPMQLTQPDTQKEKSTKRKHSRGYYKQINALVLRSLSYLSKTFSESYFSLMTAIQFAEVDTPVKTILVTSSVPGEGKTLTAANLAATYAQNGKKTLLVDLDLRRPRQHVIFLQEKREPGFSDYFASLALPQGDSGNGLIREINTPNLHLLTCGQIPPNPVALLGSDRMSALLEEWNKVYDIIILDSPPVLSVADATIIAQNVDTTLLLVECGKTKRQLAMQAKELLEQVGVTISGVILNNIDLSKHYGGYSYLYYRYYHRYYASSDEEQTEG